MLIVIHASIVFSCTLVPDQCYAATKLMERSDELSKLQYVYSNYGYLKKQFKTLSLKLLGSLCHTFQRNSLIDLNTTNDLDFPEAL